MTRRKQWLIWVVVTVLVLAAIGYFTGWWDKLPALAAPWWRRHSTVLNPLRAFLAETFSDSRTTAAVLSAAFAAGTLGVQFWVGSRQAKIGSRQAEASRISADAAMLTAKSSGNRAVASMRIKWVEDLRAVLSEYHSMLMTREKCEGEDRRQMSDLGTKLDLMMNLDEPEHKALWDLADQIYFEEDLEKRRQHDEAMMDAARVVLKTEWEKIKRELRGD
jgi:hypothetical protein